MPGNLVPPQQLGAISPASGGALTTGGGGTGMEPSREAAPKRLDVKRYLSALLRMKWLILAVTITGTAGGYLASRFIAPEYKANATVWIQAGSGQQEGGGPIQPGAFLANREWPELLRSYIVLDSVVQKMGLYLSYPEVKDSSFFKGFALGDRGFRPGDYNLIIDKARKHWAIRLAGAKAIIPKLGLEVETGAFGDSVGRRLGFKWAPPPQVLASRGRVEFSILTPREASQNLSQRLKADVVSNNFLRLTLTDASPDRSADILNLLVTQFVNQAADLKKRNLTEFSKTLREQTDFAYQNLREKENALQNFRIKTVTLPSLTTTLTPGLAITEPKVMSDFFGDKSTTQDLKRDRQSILDLLAQGDSFDVDAFQNIGAVKSAPDLVRALNELSQAEADYRALRFRYTDSLPVVKDKRGQIATLRTVVIPKYANAVVRNLQRRADDVDSRIASTGRDLQQIPERAITEARLTRDLEAADALYKNLRSRMEAAQLAEASTTPDLQILDRAVAPLTPSGKTRGRLILLGFLVGAAASIGLAMFLDFFDSRFRYPDQVSSELGLTILGAVPEIPRGSLARRSPEMVAQVIEAFRSIRMNLIHSFAAGEPVVITITSPSPRDGKSTISSNLAMSFAEAGYRTVLVDGDTRRGELHRTFGAPRTPGLIDFLSTKLSLEAVLRPTSHASLTVVPCGTRLRQAPELLASARMPELLAQLKGRFDVVVIDSPPLSAGIDPFALGSMTGNLVVVLRSGETNRQLAEAKLQILDRLPIRLLGAILNDVDTSQSLYQYYGYSYGYAAETEPVESEPQQLPETSGAKT